MGVLLTKILFIFPIRLFLPPIFPHIWWRSGHFIIQHVDDDGNGDMMMRYSPSSIEGSPTQATRLNRKIFAQTCSNVFRRNIYCRDWLTIVETECCLWGVTNEMGPVRRKIRPYFSIIKCLISSYVRGISGIKKLSTR